MRLADIIGLRVLLFCLLREKKTKLDEPLRMII